MGTLQEHPGTARRMATDARQLAALLLAVFAQCPAHIRPGILRPRPAYLPHPRRRLPRLRGGAAGSLDLSCKLRSNMANEQQPTSKHHQNVNFSLNGLNNKPRSTHKTQQFLSAPP